MTLIGLVDSLVAPGGVAIAPGPLTGALTGAVEYAGAVDFAGSVGFARAGGVQAGGLVAAGGLVPAGGRGRAGEAVDRRPAGWRVEGVGVGCGGPMRWPAGEVSPLNIPGWRGFPLRARLAERFPGVPVRLHNDAVCVAVAEHWRGAGQGTRDMLGMVVSTGVGGGLVLGGRLVDGGTGNAGHIGHVVVEPVDGPPCGCGGRGCLEAVARGPALTAWALARGWLPGGVPVDASGRPDDGKRRPTDVEGPPVEWTGRPGRVGERPESVAGRPEDVAGRPGSVAGRSEDVSGRPEEVRGTAAWRDAYREDRGVTARALAADARAGDEVAMAAMRRAGHALGVAIASATHLCDLELVTVGGGLAQAGEPLFGPLEEALRAHARMGFARRVRVTPAALGQDAGLVGAAALVLAGDLYWSSPQDTASRSATASCLGR
ncbi:ROK family protein [Nonomuraea sp. RK-328]|nr:ROK family protein [Nonomuraea sp. RK-328]